MASAPIPFTDVGRGYTIVTQVTPSTPNSAAAEQNPLQKFLKGEPKAMGVVQIMITLLMILFGIVMMFPPQTISVFSGVVFWGSLIHISAGSLAVSASNKLNVCVISATLVLNILSTIAAGIAIIMLSLDLMFHWMHYDCFDIEYNDECRYNYIAVSRTEGISGVLLVFSLLQFVVSIVVSAFTCKATCSDQPTLNIFNVVPNSASGVQMVPSNSAYQAQLMDNTMSTVEYHVESPRAYCVKGKADN
ncbi:membrane-spanning 4-domains subfamily A member 4A-like [Clarias gariepinus]|uniref:membrane-spanning 4-domains subfamily A member 4A-like n=1 Tax=Clarias gariepinus TaxID=13013 RepID=UPI00234C66C9|nr:membrane-spanning 4-domains subfamily A member 4A-like [Clarias gariepinus]